MLLAVTLLAALVAIGAPCNVSHVDAHLKSDGFYSTGVSQSNGVFYVDILYTSNAALGITLTVTDSCSDFDLFGAYPIQCSKNSTSTTTFDFLCTLEQSMVFQELEIVSNSTLVVIVQLGDVSDVSVELIGTNATFTVDDSAPTNLFTSCQTVVFHPSIPDILTGLVYYCGYDSAQPQYCQTTGDLYADTFAVQSSNPSTFYFQLVTKEGAVTSYPYDYQILNIDENSFQTSPGQIYNFPSFSSLNYGTYDIITGSPSIQFSPNTTVGDWPFVYRVNGVETDIVDGNVNLTSNANTTVSLYAKMDNTTCLGDVYVNYTFNIFQVPLLLSNIQMSVPFSFDPNTFQYTVTTASFLVNVETSANPLITCYFPNQPDVSCTQSLKVPVPSTLNIILYVLTDNPPYAVEYSINFTH